MALFPQLAETPRTSLLFNKRLNRNIIISLAVFITFVIWFFRPGMEPKPTVPPHVLWPENHEPYRFTTTTEFNPVRMDPAKSTTEELCASFPRHMLESVQPVLKMGYSENRDKVEGQLNSSSACFKPGELLIFSDLDEELRGHKVIDILAYLPETYFNTTQYKKMEPYLLQKELQANGTLDTDKEAKKKINGWEIDKFKFLPGVERAWAMKPNRDFYVFYETDTYIFWDNMFQFLQTLDPDSALYIGSPSPGRRDPGRVQGTLFANGGPGYIFSRGAMKKMLHREVGPLGRYQDGQFSERHRDLAHDEECCGDSILGYAAWLDGIILQGYYPLFTPYVLPGLLYEDPHWCQPLVTMHKTSPADMVELWKWEFANRKPRQPLLYKDIWRFFKPGGAAPNIIQNWDNEERHNYQPPAEAEKVVSQAQCEDFCRSRENCKQWVWQGRDEKKCILMDVIHYGRKREAELINDKWVEFTSGWMLDRIEKWIEARPCTEVDWVGPSLKRIF